MGLFDSLKKRKNVKVDTDADRHHHESMDYFREVEKEGMIDCPECAKAQRHVMLVETEGEIAECPECHYTLRRGRRV